MKLSYQVATPDVIPAPGVTAYQGDIEHAFSRLSECGYEGAELMVCNPVRIDADQVEDLSTRYHLSIPMICTGEVFGQDHLCFSDPDDDRRREAISRVRAAVDLACRFNAQVNIGRVRGGYMWGFNDEDCLARSIEGMKEIADYAQQKGVTAALEPVNAIACNFINSTQEGLDMVKKIANPSFRLMLDSNHMFLSDKDEIASIYEAKDVVTYVHLVDSNRLYPGSCKLNFKAFLGALKKTGYDGWLSIEVFQRPDQDTALEKSYETISSILKQL